MSFSFSQSLLGDISSSNAGPLSQELEDSQDSGYALNTNNFAFPPSVPTFIPSAAPLPFPPRRTLPRPLTWPNINQPQQGGSRWKFGGRQEVGRSLLERDLQQHMAEISRQVNNMPGKVSTIVEESVKYLHNVHSKEAIYVGEEIELMKKVLVVLEEHLMKKDTMSEQITERIIIMETGLADCAALAADVTGLGEWIKDKLSGLLHKLDREASLSRQMVGKVSSLKSQARNLSQMNNMVKAMVMKELNISKPVLGDHQQVSPPPSPIKPLPSIRRLPTLPLLSAATDFHHGGVQTVKKTQNLGDFVRRGEELGERGQGEEREYGMSRRKVRGGISVNGMDRVRVRARERRTLMEVMEIDWE